MPVSFPEPSPKVAKETVKLKPTKSLACHSCGSLFGVLRRHNFCLRCQKSYCKSCLSKRLVLKSLGNNTPVPVCESCFYDDSEQSKEIDRLDCPSQDQGNGKGPRASLDEITTPSIDLQKALREVDYSNMERWSREPTNKTNRIILHQGWVMKDYGNKLWHKWKKRWVRVTINPNQFSYFSEKPEPIDRLASDCKTCKSILRIDGYASIQIMSFFPPAAHFVYEYQE